MAVEDVFNIDTRSEDTCTKEEREGIHKVRTLYESLYGKNEQNCRTKCRTVSIQSLIYQRCVMIDHRSFSGESLVVLLKFIRVCMQLSLHLLNESKVYILM